MTSNRTRRRRATKPRSRLRKHVRRRVIEGRFATTAWMCQLIWSTSRVVLRVSCALVQFVLRRRNQPGSKRREIISPECLTRNALDPKKPTSMIDFARESTRTAAISVLVNLGFRRLEAGNAIARATKALGEEASIERVVKESLKLMAAPNGARIAEKHRMFQDMQRANLRSLRTSGLSVLVR